MLTGAGLGDQPGLAIRLASSACPTVLLILWAPVWLRSSRLRWICAPPSCRLQRSRDRAAWGGHVAGQVQVQFAGIRDRCDRPASVVQFVQGFHQSFGDEPAPSGQNAGAVGELAVIHRVTQGSRSYTPRKNARISSASLMPLADSTPLLTSTGRAGLGGSLRRRCRDAARRPG